MKNIIDRQNWKFSANLATLIDIGLRGMALTSLFVALYLLIVCRENEYHLLFLLPLFFSAVCAISFPFFKSYSSEFVIHLFLLLSFFRYVISPFILKVGDFNVYILNANYLQYIDQAIFLVLYELVFSFPILILIFKNFEKKLPGINHEDIDTKIRRPLKIFTYVFGSTIIILLVLYPMLLFMFEVFVTADGPTLEFYSVAWAYIEDYVPRICYRIFEFSISIIQIVLPGILLQSFYQKIISKKYMMKLSLLFVLSLLVMTPDKATSFFIMFALFYTLVFLHTEIVKRIIPIAILLFGAIAFIGIAVKSYRNFNSLSSMINAYFSGVPNVAVAFVLAESEKIIPFFWDILNNIPFLGYFFKFFPTSQALYNNYFYLEPNRLDQIIPMIGQGYFNFGFLLAPLLTSLCFSIAVFGQFLANRQNNIVFRYLVIFISIVSLISPFIYSFSNYIIYLSKCILLVLVCYPYKSQLRNCL